MNEFVEWCTHRLQTANIKRVNHQLIFQLFKDLDQICNENENVKVALIPRTFYKSTHAIQKYCNVVTNDWFLFLNEKFPNKFVKGEVVLDSIKISVVKRNKILTVTQKMKLYANIINIFQSIYTQIETHIYTRNAPNYLLIKIDPLVNHYFPSYNFPETQCIVDFGNEGIKLLRHSFSFISNMNYYIENKQNQGMYLEENKVYRSRTRTRSSERKLKCNEYEKICVYQPLVGDNWCDVRTSQIYKIEPKKASTSSSKKENIGARCFDVNELFDSFESMLSNVKYGNPYPGKLVDPFNRMPFKDNELMELFDRMKFSKLSRWYPITKSFLTLVKDRRFKQDTAIEPNNPIWTSEEMFSLISWLNLKVDDDDEKAYMVAPLKYIQRIPKKYQSDE